MPGHTRKKHFSDRILSRYLGGKLSSESAARVSAHVNKCRRCTAVVEGLQLGRRLRGLFVEHRPDAGLESRSAMAFHKRTHKPAFSPRSRRMLAVAAAVVVLGLFGAIISNDGIGVSHYETFAAHSPHAAPTEKVITTSVEKEQVAPREGIAAPITVPTLDSTASTAISSSTDSPLLGGGLGGVVGAPGAPGFGIGGIGGGGGGISGLAGGRSGSGGMATPPPVVGNGGSMGMMGMAGGMSGGMMGNTTSLNGQTYSYTNGLGGMPQTGTILSPTYANPTYQGILPAPTTAQPAPGGSGPPPVPSSGASSASGPGPAQNTFFQPGQYKPDAKPAVTPGEPTKSEPTQTPSPPGAANAPKKDPAAPPGEAPAEPVRRVVIRTGDIEFEVESFDAATAVVTKLVTAIKGAFIATVNSEKLMNGKIRGSITVRTPPEALDGLVLDLRKELGKGGELKGVRLNSLDVTKQYTDLESRLRGARTMEQRLLQIIKEGKGEIKQLLEAEKELGVWRTKIEEFEGELRYYANMAALSTLTIALAEKEARAAAAVTENEQVQAGVEVEDVDKAYQQLLTAVTEAKGRILLSEVKQYAAGQFNATVNFDVAPESAGPLRDRLRQLGRMARLEIDRTLSNANGPIEPNTKTKRGDTRFKVQLYNLAGIQPRETVTLHIAAADVPAAYQAIREATGKAAGRVFTSQLNEQDRQNVNAQIEFEVKRTDEAQVRAALDKAGEVIWRQVSRAPEGDNVTDTKVLTKLTLISASSIAPRETVTLQIAVADVPAAYHALREAASKLAGRVITSQLNEQDHQNVNAQVDFEVKRTDEAQFRAALDKAGEVIVRLAARAPESPNVTDAKVLTKVTLISTTKVKAKETRVVKLAAPDVALAYRTVKDAVDKLPGRVVTAQLNEQDRQNVTADLDFEVRRADVDAVDAAFQAAGEVTARQILRTPENEIASDAKVLFKTSFSATSGFKPRTTTSLTVEVPDVDTTAKAFDAIVKESQGRTLAGQSNREASGRTTAKLTYEVPLSAAPGVIQSFKAAGVVHVSQSTEDPQAPGGKYAAAKLDVTLSNAEGIVAADDGLWPQVRRGLSFSVTWLLKSVTWVIFGLCVVLPWALIGYAGFRVVRRVAGPAETTPPATTAASPPPSPSATPPA